MTDIRFYHLQKQTLDEALPALLSKALSGGHKIIVKVRDEKEAERLNNHLWTYSQNSFLPHGTQKDGNAELQPIWITDNDENPNNANVLILTDGLESDHIQDYTLCCELFDGRDEDQVKQARERWKAYKEKDFTLTYWQQTDKGWEQKAA